MADNRECTLLKWADLSPAVRDAFSGRLTGLWGSPDDRSAFEGLTLDKQQALMLILLRMQALNLWHLVRQVDNVYGEGGVGISFMAWPAIRLTLEKRRDFTRFMANHKDTSGGFYEKGRGDAILHFLYQQGPPAKWYVHFDLYSPVHSPFSALRHFRHEFLAKVTPDWRMIQRCLDRGRSS